MNKTNVNLGLLLVRVALGVVFLAHGIQKLQNIDMTVGFFGTIGLAPFFAYLVAGIEISAGTAMLVGKYTKWAGYLLAVIMIVAILKVKWGLGFTVQGGYELDFVLLLSALAVSFAGSGEYVLFKSKKQQNNENMRNRFSFYFCCNPVTIICGDGVVAYYSI